MIHPARSPAPLTMIYALLAAIIAAACVWTGPVAAVDGVYCVVNRADRTFQISRGSSFETLAPGRKACCQSNCQGQVEIGFDVSRDPDLKQFLFSLGLKALSRSGSAPAGQPIVGMDWIRICNTHWRQGDQIEVYSPNDNWRCDVVDASGQLRQSVIASGASELAQPSMRVCNYARDGSAFVVKAWSGSMGGWISDGWYEVAEDACEEFALPAGYRGPVYAYAETQNLTWPGEWELCVDPQASFEINDADRATCGWRYEHYPFFERIVDGRGTEVVLSPE